MRKLIAAAAVVVLSFGGANAAFATPPNWSPNVFIRGVYNCHLTGGFIVQPGSTGLAQFTLDGKGNVTSAPGELIVTLGEITTPSTPDDGFFFTNSASYRRCAYTPSGGSYSVNPNGTGTLTIDWTASGNNVGICSGDITTNYDILIDNPGSFTVNSTDFPDLCGDPDSDYASCGSSFTGTCKQQAFVP